MAAYAPGNKCEYYGCRRRWCPWMCATADCGALSLRAGSRRDGLPESRVEARRGRGRPRLGMASALPYNRNRTRTPLLALGRPFARFSSRYRKLRFRLRHSRVAWECWRSSARPTVDRRRAQFGPASTRSHWTQTNKSDLFLLSSPRKKEVEALHPPPCAHRASSLTLSTSHRRPSPRRPRRPDLVPFRQTFFSSTVTRTSFRLMKGSVNGGLYPAACHS